MQRYDHPFLLFVCSADRKEEEESTKEMVADMFNALWFGRSTISTTTFSLPFASPEGGAGVDFFSPTNTGGRGEMLSPAAAPTPVGVTPRRHRGLTALANDGFFASVNTPLPALRVDVDAANADATTAAASVAPCVTMLADRSVAQIVHLVNTEDNTGWLAAMIKRLLYGGDDIGDPRMGERKVCCGCLVSVLTLDECGSPT